MAEMPVTTPHVAHTSAGSNEPVLRIVLHDEEYPVGVHSAEDVAHYFSTAAAGGSSQYVVDGDGVQHPASEATICWHAPPNAHSIGIEHDGYARFTAADWQSAGSQATLRQSIALTAEICHRRGIPAVLLTAADLACNPQAKGITTHAAVSAAFHQSDHHDPGDGFPAQWYVSEVGRAILALEGQGSHPSPHPAPTPAHAPQSPSWYHRVLRTGASGDDVKHVQTRVGAKPVDGKYGPKTAAAVQVVQRAHHLTPDGVVGPDTARAIG